MTFFFEGEHVARKQRTLCCLLVIFSGSVDVDGAAAAGCRDVLSAGDVIDPINAIAGFPSAVTAVAREPTFVWTLNIRKAASVSEAIQVRIVELRKTYFWSRFSVVRDPSYLRRFPSLSKVHRRALSQLLEGAEPSLFLPGAPIHTTIGPQDLGVLILSGSVEVIAAVPELPEMGDIRTLHGIADVHPESKPPTQFEGWGKSVQRCTVHAPCIFYTRSLLGGPRVMTSKALDSVCAVKLPVDALLAPRGAAMDSPTTESGSPVELTQRQLFEVVGDAVNDLPPEILNGVSYGWFALRAGEHVVFNGTDRTDGYVFLSEAVAPAPPSMPFLWPMVADVFFGTPVAPLRITAAAEGVRFSRRKLLENAARLCTDVTLGLTPSTVARRIASGGGTRTFSPLLEEDCSAEVLHFIRRLSVVGSPHPLRPLAPRLHSARSSPFPPNDSFNSVSSSSGSRGIVGSPGSSTGSPRSAPQPPDIGSPLDSLDLSAGSIPRAVLRHYSGRSPRPAAPAVRRPQTASPRQ
jgi:CRP-like cAMP-binding protein